MKFTTVHTRMPRAFLSLTVVLTLPTFVAAATGSIQGSVSDDTGKPVPGAQVLINQALPAGSPHFTAPPVVTGPLAISVTADSNGMFSVPALPPGEYVACAEVTTPGLLDPCHWAASAPTFAVTAGTNTADVEITMARGAVVPIHVNDPQSLLQAATGSPNAPDLQVHVVTGRGIHYSAAVAASSANGRDFAVTVPFGAAVSLRVLTAHLKVNDQGGSPVSAAGSSVMVPSGAAPATVEFTITGTDNGAPPAIPGLPGLQ